MAPRHDTGTAPVLPGRPVVVCLGPGGVGKTTVAAAMGLAMARQGQRVVVLTIDPARRLADALGMGGEAADGPATLSHPTPVTDVDAGDGELWACMLDASETFEELVLAEASSPEQAERILNNSIFRNLASSLSGTNEYMAVERLHQLHLDDRFDVVVVDTPPSRHAIDFLDSPQRLTRFVDHRLYRSVFAPTNTVLRGVSAGSQLMLKVLARMVGVGLVDDVVAFFSEFRGLDQGFRRRAAELQTVLTTKSSVVVVASPRQGPLEEVAWILDQAGDKVTSIDLLVVNRASPVAPDVDDDQADPLAVNRAQLGRLAADERQLVTAAVARLQRSGHHAPDALLWISEQPLPVSDLDGLDVVARLLQDGLETGA